ncbi:MAG TPA: DarT ssDNA thymidine ADP-ribosyltransferase family protein, partial [Candidatus Hydrogenedentes bacterium]|nr:DarT ssDNA thymidine ADP-ribosyltransferase family protein [Candidatus Hydrogenedentota bacterium]
MLRLGILSHGRAQEVEHVSVAMEEIQARRKDKQIPGARRLHEYVNLYFDAHNPMLSRLRQNNDAVCVLRVHPRVLDLPEVVVADRNASSDWASSPMVVLRKWNTSL